MKKSLKIILSVITGLIMIIIVTIVALILIIDVNDFKAEIETAVKQHTGRKLSIEGDIELSLFPWLGLSTGKIRFYNPPNFDKSNFAEINHSNLHLKLLPLLSQQLEVNQLVFKGLKLKFITKKNGDNNWQDLMPQKKDSKNKTPLAILTVAGLVIEDANILWDNQQQDKRIEIKQLHFQAGRLHFDKLIPIKSSFILQSKQPKFKQSLKFSSQLLLAKSLDIFKLQNSRLQLNLHSPLLPAKTLNTSIFTNISFDKTQQHLSFSPLKIHTDTLKIHSEIDLDLAPLFVKAEIKIGDFNLAHFLKKMQIKSPKMVDDNALQAFAFNFHLELNKQAAEFTKLHLKLDESTLTGQAEIKNYQQPEYGFKLNIDRLNIDRYLPPSEKKIQAKKTSHPARIATQASGLFPIETLKKLRAAGEVTIDELKLNNLKMQGLQFKLSAQQGQLQSQQKIQHFYQGVYSGQFNLDVNPQVPKLAINEKLTQVQVEPLLNEFRDEVKLAGILSMTAKLTATGQHLQHIKSSLNGDISFSLKQADLQGFNLPAIIQRNRFFLKKTLPQEKSQQQNHFSKITATAIIEKGILKNQDLLATAPKMRLNGQGNINLISEQLDYKIQARYIKHTATENQPEVITSFPLLINITGKLKKPRYRVDLKAMLAEKNKHKIETAKKTLLEKLDDKVAPVVKSLVDKFF